MTKRQIAATKAVTTPVVVQRSRQDAPRRTTEASYLPSCVLDPLRWRRRRRPSAIECRAFLAGATVRRGGVAGKAGKKYRAAPMTDLGTHAVPCGQGHTRNEPQGKKRGTKGWEDTTRQWREAQTAAAVDGASLVVTNEK